MIYSNSKWSDGYQNRRKRIRYVSYHRNSACLRIYNVIVYYNTNQISLRWVNDFVLYSVCSIMVIKDLDLWDCVRSACNCDSNRVCLSPGSWRCNYDLKWEETTTWQAESTEPQPYQLEPGCVGLGCFSSQLHLGLSARYKVRQLRTSGEQNKFNYCLLLT